MSQTFKNLLLLIIAVVALVGGYRLAQSLRAPEAGNPTALKYGGGEMIDFTLPELDGKKHSLSEWRGKVIVLNFWATWCPPCREEIPLFIDLQKRRGKDGLQIVGVAVDNKMAVMVYRQSEGMNYPILMGSGADNSYAEAMQMMAKYGNHTGSLPFSVIIDRSGLIIVRKLGAFTRVELESLLEPMLTASTGSAP